MCLRVSFFFLLQAFFSCAVYSPSNLHLYEVVTLIFSIYSCIQNALPSKCSTGHQLQSCLIEVIVLGLGAVSMGAFFLFFIAIVLLFSTNYTHSALSRFVSFINTKVDVFFLSLTLPNSCWTNSDKKRNAEE